MRAGAGWRVGRWFGIPLLVVFVLSVIVIDDLDVAKVHLGRGNVVLAEHDGGHHHITPPKVSTPAAVYTAPLLAFLLVPAAARPWRRAAVAIIARGPPSA